VLAVVGCLLDA
ncbi:hypothetical protein D039_1333B, partial [Vibrio parahaemolyticus EKP-028]